MGSPASSVREKKFVIRRTETLYTRKPTKQTLEYELRIVGEERFPEGQGPVSKFLKAGGTLLLPDREPTLEHLSAEDTRHVLRIRVDGGGAFRLESHFTRQSLLSFPIHAIAPERLRALERAREIASASRISAEAAFEASRAHLEQKKAEHDAAVSAQSLSVTLAEASAAANAAQARLHAAQAAFAAAEGPLAEARGSYQAAQELRTRAQKAHDAALAEFTAATQELLIAEAHAAEAVYNDAVLVLGGTIGTKVAAEELFATAESSYQSAKAQLAERELRAQQAQTAVTEASSALTTASVQLAAARARGEGASPEAAQKLLSVAKAAREAAEAEYEEKRVKSERARAEADRAIRKHELARSAQERHPVVRIGTRPVSPEVLQLRVEIENAGTFPGGFRLELFACDDPAGKRCENRRMTAGTPTEAVFVLKGSAPLLRVRPKYLYLKTEWTDLLGQSEGGR
ncbi:MAG: hypothetical protein NDJ90_07805 [Oligoflexia bacterium]|nr:hypothetical protein [Oligoflexia bacterium]